MPFLIDGHNLIPKLGISLRALDDELQLVRLLQEYCRLQRKQVDVYFDNAPPGQDGKRKFGSVTAHFVRQGQTADEAIRRRLKKLGNSARNWTVVSSDHQVQAEARAARAQVIGADEFANLVKKALRERPAGKPSETGLSAQEVQEWLEIFKSGE